MGGIQSKVAKYVRRRGKTNKNQDKQQTLEIDSKRFHIRKLLNFKITMCSAHIEKE